MTPTQNRLKSKYGTHDEAEIVKLKSSEPQKKLVPQSKSASVSLKADQCKTLCDAAGIEYLEGYEERVIQYTLSDEAVDRDGDIMIQAGADLVNFMKNPVTLLFHDSRTFPVGNFIKLWVDVSAKELKGWILFVDDRVDTSGMADRAFRFAKSRIMRAGSIGFQGTDVKFPTKEERVYLGMRDFGVIFSKWELMEFSLCPVPSNPHALSDAVKAGTLKATDLIFAETSQDEEIPMTKEELDAYLKTEMGKAIEEHKAASVEKGGRAISRANRDRLKGCHGDLEKAVKALKEMIDEHEEEEEETEEEAGKSVVSAEDKELEALALAFKDLGQEVNSLTK